MNLLRGWMMSLPNRVIDDISNAVQSAIDYGISVKDFIRAVKEEWDIQLRTKARFDAQEFKRELNDVDTK